MERKEGRKRRGKGGKKGGSEGGMKGRMRKGRGGMTCEDGVTYQGRSALM